MKLPDHVAIVTGASRGIGRAIALRLAREGCHIAGVSRSTASLKETAAAIAEADPDAPALAPDGGPLPLPLRLLQQQTGVNCNACLTRL